MKSDVYPDTDAVARRSASVLIIEPHEICHRAMLLLLRAAGPGLVSVGAVKESAAGVALAFEKRPDVVLIATIDPEDYRYVREILEHLPNAKVVVLSIRSDGWAVSQALRSGAVGFVPKWAKPEEIIEALHLASRGESYVHPSVAGEALIWAVEREQVNEQNHQALSAFTRREREVLDLLSEGFSAGMIAARLFVSRRTVESHLASVYRKLGAHGRIQALKAYQGLSMPAAGESA